MAQRIDGLLSLLDKGRPLVVMCGSAISGVAPPRVPMVGEFSAFLFATFNQLLKSGTVLERTAASYCRDLLDGGRFEGIRKQTKFEELIEIVQRHSDRSITDELMALTFTCREKETGFNHCAISHLLRMGAVSGCITTNFDNAIELALGDCDSYEKSVYPNFPSTASSKPFLHKIHGDVEKETYINTNTGMLRALRKNSHEGVIDFLREAVLLSVGYSGNGDIDILPMLKASGALLTACVRPGDPPLSWPLKCWTCDLSKNSTKENFLVALAVHFGWKPIDLPGMDHQWQSQVANWCARLTSDQCINVVQSIFSSKNEDPVLHLHLVKGWSAGVPKGKHANDFETARTLINCALYSSGLRILRTLDEIAKVSAPVRHLRGFALWRKGHLGKAIKELTALVHDNGNSLSHAEDLRTYLEAAQEYVSFMPSKKRRLLVYLGSGLASEKLRLNPGDHSRAFFLAQFAQVRLEWTISNDLDQHDVTSRLVEQYKNFRDLQMYAEAALVARAAAEFSLPAARSVLSTSCDDLRNEASWLTLSRNYYILRLIDKLNLNPRLSYFIIEGKHRRWAQSPVHEINYRIKRQRWYAEYVAVTTSILKED